MVDRFRGLSAALLGLAWALLSACGGDSQRRGGGADEGDHGGASPQGGASGSGTGGHTGGATSGGANATGGIAGVSTGGVAGTAGSAASGGGGASGASGGTAGSPGAGNGGAGNGAGVGGAGGASVRYSTCQFGSGIARIVIGKLDPESDSCTVLVISIPGTETLGITLPPSTGVESAFYLSPARDDCLVPRPPEGSAVNAISGTGVLTFNSRYVDVDVTLDFGGEVPASSLVATDLDTWRTCG